MSTSIELRQDTFSEQRRSKSMLDLNEANNHEVETTSVRKIDPQKTSDDWGLAYRKYQLDSSLYLEKASNDPNFVPSNDYLSKMEKNVMNMQKIAELLEKRHSWETKTYGAKGCEKDFNWFLTKFSTGADTIVDIATIFVLGQDAVQEQINPFSKGNEESIEESIVANSTTPPIATQPVAEDEVFSIENLLWLPVAMIIISIVFSKIRDCAYETATKAYERISILDEVLGESTKQIEGAFNRLTLLKRLGKFRQTELTNREARQIKKFRAEFEELSSRGVKDPFAIAARNLVKAKTTSVVTDRVYRINCEGVDSPQTENYHPEKKRKRTKKKRSSCCVKKSGILSMKDIKKMDKDLKDIVSNLQKTTKQVGEIIAKNTARDSDLFGFKDKLLSNKCTLHLTLKKAEEAEIENSNVEKKDKIIRTVVLAIIESVSLLTVGYDQYEETIGEPNLMMKYVGLGAFIIGAFISKIYDYLLITETNKDDIEKELDRILKFEIYKVDIDSLIKLVVAQEKYRKEENEEKRKSNFIALWDRTYKLVPTALFNGERKTEVLQNLAMSADAIMLVSSTAAQTEKERRRIKQVNRLRKQISRNVRRQSTTDYTSSKWNYAKTHWSPNKTPESASPISAGAIEASVSSVYIPNKQHEEVVKELPQPQAPVRPRACDWKKNHIFPSITARIEFYEKGMLGQVTEEKENSAEETTDGELTQSEISVSETDYDPADGYNLKDINTFAESKQVTYVDQRDEYDSDGSAGN